MVAAGGRFATALGNKATAGETLAAFQKGVATGRVGKGLVGVDVATIEVEKAVTGVDEETIEACRAVTEEDVATVPVDTATPLVAAAPALGISAAAPVCSLPLATTVWGTAFSLRQ